MTMEVLQDRMQINNARRDLANRGLSFIDSPMRSLMRKLGLVDGAAIGDEVKSWDVLSTVNFLESHLQKDEPILDIGCYSSEVIVALHKLGYSKLSGADLNPDLRKMPFHDSIRYEIADFMHTNFAGASFRAITSISVMEHGFDARALLKEMSRLLRPGGYFISSFDYWPEKIDTSGTKFFGMDWKIFSKDEIANFVNEAAGYGLFPVAQMRYLGKDKVINCGGKQYIVYCKMPPTPGEKPETWGDGFVFMDDKGGGGQNFFKRFSENPSEMILFAPLFRALKAIAGNKPNGCSRSARE